MADTMALVHLSGSSGHHRTSLGFVDFQSNRQITEHKWKRCTQTSTATNVEYIQRDLYCVL